MSRLAALAEWVWHGDGIAASAVRGALSPASALFSAVVARRNGRFDAGIGVRAAAVPAISVGNLTVGGTGKTPVASWCARTLQEMGGQPAIVMRGYGDDEWRVHTLLNPDVPVERNADRLQGLSLVAKSGADCAVLDDAFQHRRAARVADLALIAADTWTGHVRTLPAGPWREPLASLRRATVAVITVKAAGDERVEQLQQAIRVAAPGIPIAVLDIVPDGLRAVRAGDDGLGTAHNVSEPLERVRGRTITAVSAIGDPASFERQLSLLGATLRPLRFRDHHAFSRADVNRIVDAADDDGLVVCTLKDAVKLATLWPRAAPPLWYVSQTIEVRLGRDALHDALTRVLTARNLPRAASRPTAG